MDEKFIDLVKEIHKERIQKEFYEVDYYDKTARDLKRLFWLWCMAFQKEENVKSFTTFLKDENQNLKEQGIIVDFWVKKKFLENYYNYTFEFDKNKGLWFIANLNRYIKV